MRVSIILLRRQVRAVLVEQRLPPHIFFVRFVFQQKTGNMRKLLCFKFEIEQRGQTIRKRSSRSATGRTTPSPPPHKTWKQRNKIARKQIMENLDIKNLGQKVWPYEGDPSLFEMLEAKKQNFGRGTHAIQPTAMYERTPTSLRGVTLVTVHTVLQVTGCRRWRSGAHTMPGVRVGVRVWMELIS